MQFILQSFFSVGVCHCNSAISISGEAYLRVLVTKICTGSPYPPCVYDGSKLSNKVRHNCICMNV